jgi:hypothetical protein
MAGIGAPIRVPDCPAGPTAAPLQRPSVRLDPTWRSAATARLMQANRRPSGCCPCNWRGVRPPATSDLVARGALREREWQSTLATDDFGWRDVDVAGGALPSARRSHPEIGAKPPQAQLVGSQPPQQLHTAAGVRVAVLVVRAATPPRANAVSNVCKFAAPRPATAALQGAALSGREEGLWRWRSRQEGGRPVPPVWPIASLPHARPLLDAG